MTDAALAALGRVPSGLFILTVGQGARATGMLASWVQQCSFDPPRVSAAFAKDRWVLDWLTDGAAFAVNVLPEGEKKLVAHFGKGFGPDESAFEGVEVVREGDAAPMLAAALAHLTCRVAHRYDAGDHILVIGTVEDGAVRGDGRPATHVRKSGNNY